MTRYYVSTALPTVLAANLGASGNPSVISLPGTWPASFPYTVLLDWGTSAQEAILVTSAPTGTGPYALPCTRGIDLTTAQAHNAGAQAEHGTTGYEPALIQANAAAIVTIEAEIAGGVGGVQLAADLGNTDAAPQVVSTHLASPLPAVQGGTGAGSGAPAAVNEVFAGPASGSSATPGFRSLAAADVPATLNATTLPVTDSGGQVFNVKSYGAVGNGSHDDTSASGAAIAAAVAAGQTAKGNGGTVLFPPGGHYMVSQLDFSAAATGKVSIHVIADGAIIEHNASAGGVFVNFSGVTGTAVLQFCSFTGALLYPKQSSTNPTTDLVYMTCASHNTLDVKVFDQGMFASSSGSAVYFYGRSGQGCYYNTISLRCAAQPGYTNSYGGNGLTLDGWATSGPYLQSNLFPAVYCERTGGIGINDLGSGVNVFVEADCEYNTGYGLVVNTESQGLRFLNFYMEGNNGVTGDQWSIPTGSANAGTSTFAGNLSVTPTDADRSYWAFYQDNAYGGVQSHAGTTYHYPAGSQYPLYWTAASSGAIGVRQSGDTANRITLGMGSGGVPNILMGVNGTSTFIALEVTATGTPPAVGPGSSCTWKPFGGEAYRYTSETHSTSPTGSPYAVQIFDRAMVLDCTAGNIGLNLPSGQTPDGSVHVFTKIDSSANTAVITPTGGSYTINGASTYTLSTQWQFVEIMFNEANDNWIIISS